MWISARGEKALVCDICGLIRFEPFKQPGIESLYDDHYYAIAYETRAEALGSFFESQLARIEEVLTPGRCIDIGCGMGLFVKAALAHGWDAFGTDPSEAAVRRAEAIAGPGCIIQATSPSSLGGTFELITMWDVLAHVDELDKTLAMVKQKLSRNGLFIVKTPHHSDRLFARVRTISRLNKKRGDQILHLPRQLNHFTPDSLTAVLELHGLKTCCSAVTQEVLFERRVSAKEKLHDLFVRAVRWRMPASFILCATHADDVCPPTT